MQQLKKYQRLMKQTQRLNRNAPDSVKKNSFSFVRTGPRKKFLEVTRPNQSANNKH